MAHEGLDRFLPWRKVQDITGLGRTTAWRLRRTGDFPHPVPISPGRVAWRERDIALWNETRGSPEALAHALQSPRRSTLRPPEPRALEPAPPPSADLDARAHPVSDPGAPKPARKSRSATAEGQLGFDF